MQSGDIRILKAHEIRTLLSGREQDILDIVQHAYEIHASGASSLPHSTFLTFPEEPANRIIALPAYLGQEFDMAGVKWIASFPGNHDLGLERASAVMIVNSAATGRPEAILEGSLISAKRTAASAALAARHLHAEPHVTACGMIGCGLINFEILRFLLTVFPSIEQLTIFDRLPAQAERFREQVATLSTDLRVVIADDVEAVFAAAALCSFATTAGTPYIHDLSACRPGSTLLHISLRDLAPELILAADNIVDDVDHVTRAQTSIHLAEQQIGNRDFIRCTLADVTRGNAVPRASDDKIVIFSPFGLGVLDLAVSKLVLDFAQAAEQGTIISSFLPNT